MDKTRKKGCFVKPTTYRFSPDRSTDSSIGLRVIFFLNVLKKYLIGIKIYYDQTVCSFDFHINRNRLNTIKILLSQLISDVF